MLEATFIDVYMQMWSDLGMKFMKMSQNNNSSNYFTEKFRIKS